jgi:hypothetical protein
MQRRIVLSSISADATDGFNMTNGNKFALPLPQMRVSQ